MRWDRQSNTDYLACRSARTNVALPHHAPWTAKSETQPFAGDPRLAEIQLRIVLVVYCDPRTCEEERRLQKATRPTPDNSILSAVTKAWPHLGNAGAQWFCSGAEDDCQGTLPTGIRFAPGLSGWGPNPGRVT